MLTEPSDPAILVAAGQWPTAVFRIAHVSDLHVLSPHGIEWRRMLFNKRITGYANLLAHRARMCRREYLLAVLSAAPTEAVVVTGDARTSRSSVSSRRRARPRRRVARRRVFGHLHLPVRRPLPTAAGGLDAIAASGAALDHPHPAVRAGFNAYAMSDDGRLVAAEARVVAPDGRTLRRVPLLDGPGRT